MLKKWFGIVKKRQKSESVKEEGEVILKNEKILSEEKLIDEEGVVVNIDNEILTKVEVVNDDNEIEEKIIEEDWLISENTIKLDDKEAIINDKNIELCKKEVQVESELKQKSERGECIAFTFLYIKQEGVKRDGGRK